MFRQFLETHDLARFTFRSDLFPTLDDRDFWENFQNETCVSLAEEELDYGWPIIKATDFMEFKKSGNRKIMENPHFDRRSHLVLFVLAELKENEGRFLPQIVNGLFAICEESYWGLSAHFLNHKFERPNIPTPAEPYIDLYAAETAEQLSMTVTLLKQPLLGFCPEIVKRVEYELNKRIKEPYENRFDFGWMGHQGKRVNNWNPWILSNVLTVFLLCEREERRKERAVRKILWEAQNYYDAIPDDGGCDEGPHYWNRAGASLFELVYQLKIATDGALDLFADEKLGRMASYMQKAHLAADYFVNVADAHAVGIGTNMPMLFGFARETQNKELMNFSVAVYRERADLRDPLDYKILTLRRLILNEQFIRQMSEWQVSYPLHGILENLPNMELATLRRGDMILSVKGGFNEENHNHNDVGSFVLYENIDPILIDVGIGTYTKDTFSAATRYKNIPWTRGSYHNIPLINGAEQVNGKQYRADRFEATEEEIFVSCAGAYPTEAQINGLTRSFSLSEKGLTVTDRFEFAKADRQSVCEVFMTVLPVRIEQGEAILGERYRMVPSKGVLRYEQICFGDPSLTSDWNAEFVTRILLECEHEQEICIKVELI
ncbi:MAG: heparinase II/III family protein [Clostridia bacterium]|nr:heparinase II/III family protein [Clostridia bacterium]